MADRRTTPRVKLAVESLESREVPSGTPGFLESFDATTPGGLPAQWASYNLRGATFAAGAGTALGPGAGLTTASDSSAGIARVWQGQFVAANVQASVAVHLDSLEPAQLFVRGNNLDSDTPTYYAVSVTRGLDVKLLKVVDGKTTVLADLQTTGYLSESWIRLTLVARGDQLTVQVFRTETAQYLNANGTWSVTPGDALSATDGEITAAGQVGLNRPAQYAGDVSYDNFGATSNVPAGSIKVIHEEAFAPGPDGQPQGWTTWTNGGSVQVTDDRTLTGSGSLTASGASNTAVRTWLNTIVPADAQVSTAVYLDSLVPAQLFARGQDLSSATPSYYGVNVTRGLQVQLVRVLDGQTTVLGTLSSKDYFSSQWVRVSLSLQGDRLRVQIYRTDSGQYLAPDGSWQVAPVWALDRRDDSITGDGRVGLGRPAGYSGAVSFDDLVITGVPGAGGHAGGGPDGTGTQRYTWDDVAPGMQPAGWTQWSNNFSAGFHVSALDPLSRPASLVATGNSSASTRFWLESSQPADVRVGTAVYLDSLVPARVIARGSDLGTDSPSYYAAQVTRGAELQILRVVDGQTTVLATIKSDSYFSGQWVRLSLIAVGGTLQAVLQRTDTSQYLNADGEWQSDATAALQVTDTALTGGGAVGLDRPASYSGRVLFDDFTVSASPTKASYSAPTGGGTGGQTGGTGGSTGGQTGGTGGSTGGTGGSTGGTGDSSGGTGSSGQIPGMPTIPQHYDWIRIAQLAYAGTPLTAVEQQLLRESVDLVVPNIAYLDSFAQYAPDTPKMIYSNVSNLYLNLLTDWLNWADANGVNREDAFYHAKVPTAWSGSSPSSPPVNWFWAAFQQTGDAVTDRTLAARSNTSSFALGGVGSTLSLGYTDPFREVNVNLVTPGALGHRGVWEYASAVDANGNPTAWKTLSLLSDGTSGMTRSGQITFDPPSDWATARMNGTDGLYYVRYRTTSAGVPPVIQTVLGRDYVNANGTTSGTIPAFDKTADANGDGYLDDDEYANRQSGYDARFVYETRMFYPVYGQMRFAANVADADYRAWAADYSYRFLAANPNAGGLFMDNSRTASPFTADQVYEADPNYAANYIATIQGINQRIAPRWVLANTAGVSSSFDPIPAAGISYMEEFAIRPMAHNWTQLEYLADAVQRRSDLSGDSIYTIIDSYPSNGDPTDPRTMIGTLAYYYLMADPQKTFLMFNGGYEPSSSWTRHWTDAVKFDVGQPTEDMTVFATGKDPSNSKLQYKVYEREYENALVLFKPLSYSLGQGQGTLADNTATTHLLNGTYRLLNADGTLGPPITKVTLRNGEGAILVKV